MNKIQALKVMEANRRLLLLKAGRWCPSVDACFDILQRSYVRILESKVEDIRDPIGYAAVVMRRMIWEDIQTREGIVKDMTITGLAGKMALDRTESNDPSPEDEVDLERYILHINHRLSIRNAKCRTIYVMHEFEGYTYDEIADRIPTSPSMVKKYLFQARETIAMSQTDFERAKALYEYSRADRIKAEKALREAQREEVRRAQALAVMMKGNLYDNILRIHGTEDTGERTTDELLGRCKVASA